LYQGTTSVVPVRHLYSIVIPSERVLRGNNLPIVIPSDERSEEPRDLRFNPLFPETLRAKR
jgi:hypothetical protein